ncbi:RNA-guided endonuclease TnpB family protein [Thiomonas sp. FB-Cd]|uniref:RNA-guided endonuclease InsQ/TnpB family protein n=1 Tax=Thiomonas sp. FB-Cd TaxID=1158292 RepID=UPI00056FB0A8|nr:RNA-guided endonuclease TnpB family protein [Thiomonas sp. FB-Cd]
MQRRKVTFKLDPNAAQAGRLKAWTRLHCELYNAAIEERIDAWGKAGKSISDYAQQNALPQIKADRPELNELGSHALQQTLRRLDLAFQSFFRRVNAGQTPGFPRFKAAKRFSGFAYPDPAGWKLLQNGHRGATLRLGSDSSAMSIRARGQHRFGADAKPDDITLTRRNDQWFVSVTLRVPEEACARQRTDDQRRGVDFGINDWATFDDGQTIANPRWMREELPRLAALQRQRARKRKGSIRYKRLSQRVARLHDRIGNLRRDFVHKETTKLVRQCAVLATEQLAPKTMSRSAKGTVDAPGRRVRQKAGLNREILSAGFGMAHPMLAYKAEETGTRLHLSNTRQLKPSRPKQRVGGAHRRAQHAWDERGGETQTSATATWQVEVCDPRNPHDNRASVLMAGEFIGPKGIVRFRSRSRSECART